MQSHILSRDGTLINLEQHGNPKAPKVIFSHCWSSSLASWKPVVQHLNPNLDAILYDQRGHGQSQTPPNAMGYSVEKLADDVCAVLEAKVPDGQKALVVGHSLGGIAIMAAAPREVFQRKVGAILLCNTGCTQLLQRSAATPLLPAPLKNLIAKLFMTNKVPLGARRSKFFLFVVKRFMLGPAADQATLQQCAEVLRACAPEARSEWGQILVKVELDEAVKQIAVPTLIAVGSNDKITPPWHAKHIVDLIPAHAESLEIPGIGHMGPLEVPSILADLINQIAATRLLGQ